MQKLMFAIVLVVGSSCWAAMCFAQTSNNRQNMTLEQRQQQFRVILQRFDLNKNGRLDAPELARVREAYPQLQRMRQNNTGNQVNKPNGGTTANARGENASQVTVGVNDQDNSYGETHNLIGSNKTEVTLTKPMTNPSVTIAYGFYSSEIQVRYSY